MSENILSVQNLHTSFHTDKGEVKAVNGVTFNLEKGKILGIVGESGSGKSVTARSIIKLLPETATTSGAVYLSKRDGSDSLDVLSLSGEQLREVRGSEAAMVFQEPNSVLNPVYTIGNQIVEVIRLHTDKNKADAWARAKELLELVGINEPEKRLKQYPHELSGGMRQRVMIAIALACEPKLLIADEPTTALDVTIQAQILELMQDLRKKLGMSIIMIMTAVDMITIITMHMKYLQAGVRKLLRNLQKKEFVQFLIPYLKRIPMSTVLS